MLLALALSVALWTIVTTQQNPDVRDVFQAIEVKVANLPPELTVRNEIAPVRVVVSAPRDVWEELRPAKFQATVDLARVGPGLQEVPIKVETVDARASIEDVTPQKAIVHLEPIRRRDVPTRARVIGAPPTGYRVGPPKTTPETTTISGPQSLVEQVVALTADVDVTGVTTNINQAYRVVPQNAAGERVDRVTLGTENVIVEARVEQERAIKTVPVAAQIAGTVAPGYEVVGLRVDPTAITLEGEPRVMEPLESVSTVSVPIDNATGDLSVNTTLQLPEGVRVPRAQPIVVRVFVSPIEGSKAIDIAPTLQGERSGTRATPAQSSVRVTLGGPMPGLSGLGPREVRAVVDVTGLTVGTHQIPPRIEAPQGVRVLQTDPQRVDVRIAQIEPTATPPPSPSPVQTATPP